MIPIVARCRCTIVFKAMTVRALCRVLVIARLLRAIAGLIGSGGYLRRACLRLLDNICKSAQGILRNGLLVLNNDQISAAPEGGRTNNENRIFVPPAR